MAVIRSDRFSLIVSPFFAFALAVGFLLVLYTFYDNARTRKIALVFGLVIFSYLCFSAITFAATDSVDVSSHQGREYFTEPEMHAFAFIPQFVNYNSTISADGYSSRILTNEYFSETKTLNLPSYQTTPSFELKDAFTFYKGFFVLRNQELESNGLLFQSASGHMIGDAYYYVTFEPTEDILGKFANLTFTSQKIYDNRMVSILAN
jgi:hypothetical protein